MINFSTSVVGLYQPTYGVYAATKAARRGADPCARQGAARRDITVNAVAPGPDGHRPVPQRQGRRRLIDTDGENGPAGRLGQPEDIAAVVAFLAGPDGGWVNGQVLRANGGVI